MPRRPLELLAGLAGLAAVVVACSGDDDGGAAEGPSGGAGVEQATGEGVIVFNAEGNNLNAYEPEPPFAKQTVIPTVADDPDGMDINGQICFLPDGSGRFVAGEDTGQPERTPGWGIFQLGGDTVGNLSAREVGRLVPTYQADPENYGCGVLSDGRIVTTDVGNQVTGDPNGQLIVWFPPFDDEDVSYCKLDVTLGTAGGIHIVRDFVYVAAARGGADAAGIYRYRGPFPTSDDEGGGCGRTDGTGAPVADEVDKELFIPADTHVATPNAVVGAPEGGFYVSSAFTGVLAHYDRDGAYVRTLVSPPPGEQLGSEPYSTGSPMGLGVDPTSGAIYWADLGIGIGDSVGPVDGAGKVRRTAVDENGESTSTETMDDRLDFPDGIGVYAPP